MKSYRIIISGGGTGGHIFPAISIANVVRERYLDAEILFVGAENRMEMERVPAAGYKIAGLPVSGFDRSRPLKNIQALARLLKSLRLAKKIICEFKPDIAIGVGGYASGPTLQVAASLGIPILIQEQNSYAGVTNKLLAKKAQKICVAYDGMEKFFSSDKIILTGNPVRKDLVSDITGEASGLSEKRAEACRFFSLSPEKKTILVIGGSLGARTINRSVQNHLDGIVASGVQLIWQTGRYYYNDARGSLEKYDDAPVRCFDFIIRMDYAYAAADLVISRAGAGTISELCLLGRPVILVPSPNVAEDHQTKNALALTRKEAAILVTDREAEQVLIPKALEAAGDEALLARLSEHIRTLALPDSAERIVDEIVKIMEEK
ncbi:MAG: undecaprenyldiphospho-muramoylpentapeptide beta-N-acetylglucosaminyltransferase [Tannerellaceae bacterium]|jgi:UDP-N-acetylglucosamine--N-acetylmuramyl-(pentapeptide) pyrophosphoryl-undecaprenol N-acetylglucosamine transferase|nr:undecaprenyldiphospho-muramoylpentapeptide beta-N-acetylglucosaminyltransferase [Tannerellaceae bacterium]